MDTFHIRWKNRFDVRQGWQPLCQFLNVTAIPEEPFPKMNEKEDFIKMVVNSKVSTWTKLLLGSSACMMLAIGVLAYCIV